MHYSYLKKVCDYCKLHPFDLPLVLIIFIILFTSLTLLLKKNEIKKIAAEPQKIIAQAAPSTQASPKQFMLTKKIIVVHSDDTLFDIFQRAEIPKKDYFTFVNNAEIRVKLMPLRSGQRLQFFTVKNNRLIKLIYQIDCRESIEILRFGNVFKSKFISTSLNTKQILTGFTIKHSILHDTKQNKIPIMVVMELNNIFHKKLLSSKKIHAGDTIKIIYQKFYDENKPVAIGNIIAAKIITPQKTYEVFRYDDQYYTFNGKSLTPAFVRFPLKFKRISSPFTLRRWHPILHIYRAHEGVDFAAPIGTPVKASCDGIITDEQWGPDYGNFIVLSHDKTYSALYGHLSRFADNVTKGDHVTKGQVIGYVGQSGLATGPHLHYEFRINGIHVDPLTVKLPSNGIDSGDKLLAFKAIATTIDSKFNSLLI